MTTRPSLRPDDELWFHSSPEQRTTELVHAFALDHDTGCRTLKHFDVGYRQPHVLKYSAFNGLKPNTLPMINARKISNRSIFEQIEIVGDIDEILPGEFGAGWTRKHFVAVFFRGRQSIGPHHGPRRGRGFSGDRRRPRFGRHRLAALPGTAR